MATASKTNRQLAWISIAGLIIGVAVAGPVLRSFIRSETNNSTDSQEQIVTPKKPIDLQSIAAPHLQEAADRSQQIIDDHLEPIDTFFQSTKEGTAKFAELSLGWGSKWRLVADSIPYTQGDRHSEYLRSKFEEFVFTPEQFEKVIRQSIDGYLAELRSIESKMLVDLKADLDDFPADSVLRRLDSTQWQESFDEAIAKATDAAADQLGSDVATQLVSIITGEVLAQVAVRLGVSSGILTTGAASGWATFGIGVAIGLVIDQLVTIAWDHWADPKGKLTKQLNMKIQEINILIRNGDSQVQGLRTRFRQIADQRAVLRKDAIMELLKHYSSGGVRQ
jgi:hypothetical protein